MFDHRGATVCQPCCADFYFDVHLRQCLRCGPNFTTDGKRLIDHCNIPRNFAIRNVTLGTPSPTPAPSVPTTKVPHPTATSAQPPPGQRTEEITEKPEPINYIRANHVPGELALQDPSVNITWKPVVGATGYYVSVICDRYKKTKSVYTEENYSLLTGLPTSRDCSANVSAVSDAGVSDPGTIGFRTLKLPPQNRAFDVAFTIRRCTIAGSWNYRDKSREKSIAEEPLRGFKVWIMDDYSRKRCVYFAHSKDFTLNVPPDFHFYVAVQPYNDAGVGFSSRSTFLRSSLACDAGSAGNQKEPSIVLIPCAVFILVLFNM